MRYFLALAVFLITLALLLALREESGQMADPALLQARHLPGKKVPLVSKVKINLLSSAPGKAQLLHGKKKEVLLWEREIEAGDNTLRWRQSLRPGRYRLLVENDDGRTLRSSWRVRYPSLEMGSRGREVRLLHRGLRRLGYGNAPRGSEWNEYTSLAVLAFRKTNRLPFEETASPQVLRMVLRGRGAFPLREKREGKYVEVDLARQVMVLAEDGKPRMTYHISSGAPATPSDLGRYTFYSKLAGYNSLGMYYSVFYNRGEATHGFASVPSYPASHGCIRNPIPSSVQIYNWIPLGAPIWVY